MKNLNLLMLLLLGFALSFTACKKDDNPEPTPTQQQQPDNTVKNPKPEPTTKELLMDKKWVVTAIVFDEPIDMGNGEFLTDLYDLMPDCEKDDYMIFKANDMGIGGVGEDLCDSSETDDEFLWYQNPDDKNELWLDMDGETIIMRIMEVHETTLIFEIDADMMGEKVPVKLHMKSV